MADLRHIANRLATDTRPADVVCLCYRDGLWYVRVEWGDHSKDCTKASTALEAVDVALNDLFDPAYNRQYRG